MKQDRYAIAAGMQTFKNKSALDCGCRDKVLKSYLKPTLTTYKGIDFYEDSEVIKHNLENGIPFNDNSFDVVFALDVIEHVENLHFLLQEMMRVASNEIIVAFPNMYHYSYRIKYLLGKEISEKYRLPHNKVLDRHRWLTFYNQYDKLVHSTFSSHSICTTNQPQSHNTIRVLNFVDSTMINLWPGLTAFTTFYSISKACRNV